MSIREQMKQDAEEHGMNTGGDFLQFETGDYRLRILTKAEALATHFFGPGQPSHICYGSTKGCPFHGEGAPKDEKTGKERSASVKYMAYVLDRKDGKVKLAELPWSVLSRIADFEEDEDYKFDAYPMPYDVKIKVDKANKDPKSIYKTEASPKSEPVTEAERDLLMASMEKLTPADFVDKRKKNELNKQMENGVWQKAADERAARVQVAKEKTEQANDGVDDVVAYPENTIEAGESFP